MSGDSERGYMPQRYYEFCDKCGEKVPLGNDALLFEAVRTGDWTILYAEPRHLLPTTTCEGSPSRAQYLPRQPPDPRGQHPYNDNAVEYMRAIYDRMQEIAQAISMSRAAASQVAPDG